MSDIRISKVAKAYGGGETVLRDINLEIVDGEFMVLVGPSGCGKSTLLRMVAGLESITEGRIELDGETVNDISAKDRGLAMIFQTYALFPHMTVRQNLAFGMKLRKVAKPQIDKLILQAATTLGLLPYMDRYPSQLSGGQRQRVAIGRALVRKPRAFLMDEPLSNLDAKLRVSMRTEFLRLRDQLGTTTMYVTHDQVEAMTLGHRVCVLLNGEIQQVATPDDLFHRPANVFVAGFIGTPEMNMAMGAIADGQLRLGENRLPLPDGLGKDNLPAGEVIVGIRPTDIEPFAADQNLVPLQIEAELVEKLGSENLVVFKVAAKQIQSDSFAGLAQADANRLQQDSDSRQAHFTASLPGKMSIAKKDNLTLGIEPERIHLFDPATGIALANGHNPA